MHWLTGVLFFLVQQSVGEIVCTGHLVQRKNDITGDRRRWVKTLAADQKAIAKVFAKVTIPKRYPQAGDGQALQETLQRLYHTTFCLKVSL